MSINYRQLRGEVRIEEVLSWMSWEASSRVGDQLRGCCPLCTSLTADPKSRQVDRKFSVHASRHIYRCFRCDSGGNALDLWSSYRKFPLDAAAQKFQSRLSQTKQP